MRHHAHPPRVRITLATNSMRHGGEVRSSEAGNVIRLLMSIDVAS